jgi:hypothetical protein
MLMRKLKPLVDPQADSIVDDLQRSWLGELRLQTVALDPAHWSERARLASRCHGFDYFQSAKRPLRVH